MIYLSLGSNLGDRIKFLKEAVTKISDRCGTIVHQSPYYETEPVGFEAENQFINACIAIECDLNPNELLQELQIIEKESGRKKSELDGYASRNLDIDIIFYNHEVLTNENLKIPHPRFQDRLFVLQPLNDIASDFIDPLSGESINTLLNICIDVTQVSLFKID